MVNSLCSHTSIIVKDGTMSINTTNGGVGVGGPAGQKLDTVLQNKLPEDLGRLVQLVNLNPLVHRVSLLDAARAEDHGGNVS